MSKPLAGWAIAIAVGVSVQMPSLGAPAQQTTTPPLGAFEPVVKRYCTTCHDNTKRTGGVTLERIDFTDVHANAEIWEKVLRKLHSGSMPPPGVPRPEKVVYEGFTSALESSLDRAALMHPNPGRVPALHRLNRTEYSNVVRDLLAVDIDATTLLPADDSGYGFDNIADVLSISPMLMDRYMSAALNISRIAVGDPTLRPATDVFNTNKYLRQDDRVGEDLPFGSRGGLAVRYFFPVDADYIVKIFFLRTYDGRVRGLSERNELQVRLDREKIKSLIVGVTGDPEAGEKNVRESQRQGGRNLDIDGTEVRFSAKAGPGVVGVSFIKSMARPEFMLRPNYSVTSYEYAGDASVLPGISSIEIRGPYDVKGPGNSPSRQRIFVCRPRANADAATEDRCARQILSTLARRAFRRPVVNADVEPLLAFYKTVRAKESFDTGIEAALQRILVSPEFLFRTESDPGGIAPGTAYRISDLELASRLSFFIWSSIPDDELLDLAARGRLTQPGVLAQQVQRMLADDRSKELVRNFTGQWLYLRNLQLISPDPYVFPDFDENLRQAFERELELFLDSQVREDHGIPKLLDSEYTFVNERLARHYGIPNVAGEHFRRIVLTDDARRGLLGKGGILTITSYANRTAPTLRGKFLLENILGAPPPPPPPNVPSLKETGDDIRNLSMRQRMEQHRANPVCASCHKQMDPLGFALENFDAVGHWRTKSEAGSVIDASATLADGTNVNGPIALRTTLLAHREDFVATVTSKLLTYALGRGVEYYDGPAVRGIVRQAISNGARWSSVIIGIVDSPPFQMRMSEPRSAEASLRRSKTP